MMTCRELVEFLEEYIAGTLPSRPQAIFEQHLENCPSCVHYVDSYQTTIQLVKETAHPHGTGGAATDPPAMPEELIQAILAARRSEDP